jgi:hypothetical protein
MDQHMIRSHPNKAADVVGCQTFWIDFGSRFINSGSALQNQSLGIGTDLALCAVQNSFHLTKPPWLPATGGIHWSMVDKESVNAGNQNGTNRWFASSPFSTL